MKAEKHKGMARRAVTRALRLAIKAYQVGISSWTPPRCRFYPSCSSYTLQAVELYGPVRGLLLGAKRIIRCHPWNEGGYDPLV